MESRLLRLYPFACWLIAAWTLGCDRRLDAGNSTVRDGSSLADAMAGFMLSWPGAPAGSIALNGTAYVEADRIVLTDEVQAQAASAFLMMPFDLTGVRRFEAHLAFRIAPDSSRSADGIALVWQRADRGANALGLSGGGIGYEDLTPSLAVELDIFDETGVEGPEHVAIARDGERDNPVAKASPLPIRLAAGAVRHAWVEWEPRRLSVFLAEGSGRPSAPVLVYSVDLVGVLGGPCYFGITGATGGNSARQEIVALDVRTFR